MQTTISIAVITACLSLGACKKKEENKGGEASSAAKVDPGKSPTGDLPQPKKEEPPPPPKPIALSPAAIDPEKPVPVADLSKALMTWKNGTEVTVAGYTKFFIGESGKLTSSADIVATEGGTKETPTLVKCDLATPDDKDVTNKTPLVLKGTIRGTWGRENERVLWMEKCTITSRDAAFDANAPADVGSGKPVPVQKLHDAYFGWKGKEVSVVGYYQGITTSKSSGGSIIDIRVDIATPDLTKQMGCHLDVAEPTDNLGPNRDGVVFRGTVATEAFGLPQLNPCKIVTP